jgi:hypothetical protein
MSTVAKFLISQSSISLVHAPPPFTACDGQLTSRETLAGFSLFGLASLLDTAVAGGLNRSARTAPPAPTISGNGSIVQPMANDRPTAY